MTILDYYMNIAQRRNISHFADIVRIAKSDEVITDEEGKFLKKVAKKYDIGKDLYKQIVKNPQNYPTLAFLECEERIERLYDLLKMVEVDHVIKKREVSALRKIVTGLAFPLQNVDAIVNRTIELDVHEYDLELFKIEIIKVNKF